MLIQCWAFIDYFCREGGRLFKVGGFSRSGELLFEQNNTVKDRSLNLQTEEFKF